MEPNLSQASLGLLRRLLEETQPPDLLTEFEKRKFWKDALFDFGLSPAIIDIASTYSFRWGNIIPDLYVGRFGDHNSYASNSLPPDICERTLKQLLAFALAHNKHAPLTRSLVQSLTQDGFGLNGGSSDSAIPTELEKIPGKAAMFSEVQQRLDARKLAAILYMDLDGFKQVNDTMGHTKGDECLIRVAGTMGKVLLDKGKLYRPGGDEFVAILSNFNGEEAMAVAERIRAAIDADNLGGELKVTVSIGVVSSDLTDVEGAEAIVDLADKAMYRAKQAKNCVVNGKDLIDPANEADKMNMQTETREQHAVTAAYYPRFQKLVHGFEEFVDSRMSTTLHYMIVSGGDFSGQMRDDLCKALGTVPVSLWSSLLHFFKLRIDRTPPSFGELIAGVQEFHHLLAQFNNLCMAPIFDHLPNDKRAALTEQQRSRLNGFQQRFTFYLRDYMTFGKELSQALPELQRLPRDIPYSNPL